MEIENYGLNKFDIVKAVINNNKLYITELDDGSIIFRPLSFYEHEKYSNSLTVNNSGIAHGIYEYICKDCIIWYSYIEPSIAKLPAGLISVLAKSILRLSGPSNIDELLNALDHMRESGTTIHKFALTQINGNKTKTWDDVLLKLLAEENIKNKTYRELIEEAKHKEMMEKASEIN